MLGTQETYLNGVNNMGGTYTVATTSASSFTVSYACSAFSGNGTDTGTAYIPVTTDLGLGQHITVGTAVNKTIITINAQNPLAVLIGVNASVGTIATPTALTYSAPVLGLEMQLPTKSSAAPTTLAWSQGDSEQNSSATANGVAGWVNVASGTPGTWAGIPLGDATGKITVAQIASPSLQGTDSKLLTAGTVSGTSSPLCTDANGGATTSGCPVAGSFAPVASINVSGLTANAGGTIYAVPSNGAGWYNVGCYAVVTTPATTSSTLPYCTITYTDEDTGATAITSGGGTQMIASGNSTQNLLGTTGIGHGSPGNLLIHAAASTSMTYTMTSYTSSGATPMAYAIHIIAQYVGP